MGELEYTLPKVVQSPDCLQSIDGYTYTVKSTIPESTVSEIIRLDSELASVTIHTDDFSLQNDLIHLEIFA